MEYFFAVPIAQQDLLNELNDGMMALAVEHPGLMDKLDAKYKQKWKLEQAVYTQKEKDFITNC